MTKTKRVKLAAMSVVMAVFSLGSAQAHHSYVGFDRSKTIEIAGTVEKFQWTNPHSWLVVQAPDSEGVMQSWRIEMGPPGQLGRAGWKSRSFKPGDKVTVKLQPNKNGSPGGNMVSVTDASGKVFGTQEIQYKEVQ